MASGRTMSQCWAGVAAGAVGSGTEQGTAAGAAGRRAMADGRGCRHGVNRAPLAADSSLSDQTHSTRPGGLVLGGPAAPSSPGAPRAVPTPGGGGCSTLGAGPGRLPPSVGCCSRSRAVLLLAPVQDVVGPPPPEPGWRRVPAEGLAGREGTRQGTARGGERAVMSTAAWRGERQPRSLPLPHKGLVRVYGPRSPPPPGSPAPPGPPPPAPR